MDDDEDQIDNDDETKDPAAKIRAQQDQINRLHKKIGKLEANQVSESDLHTARLENAFLRHLMTSDLAISDVEAAWDLASAKGWFDSVTLNEDGTVAGMEAAMDKLVKRYPSLLYAEDEGEDEEDAKPAGGRAVQSPKSKQKGTDKSALQKRFPALRGRQGAWS